MELRLVSPQADQPASDGLPALVQGSWSEDKLYFLSYFAELFNGGMKNLWKTRAYVDLFSGPGLCIDRDTGKEFEGSTLRALGCRTPFTHLYFNDINGEYIEALRERQERQFPNASVVYEILDCNLAARSISKLLPPEALALAFIDPWTYEITFEALSRLAQRKYTDLIVTFHTTAIKRNVHQDLARVDKFLGDPHWREQYWGAEGNPSRPPTLVLLEIFQNQLRKRLNYTHFGDPAIIRYPSGTPAYYLLFASRHVRGLDFWEQSRAISPQGQRPLF